MFAITLVLILAVFSSQVFSQTLCLEDHNKQRAANGKKALNFNPKLEAAAKTHNEVMTSKNCFSHRCAGESELGTRVKAAGYKWSIVGENLAAGQKDCKTAMEGWMNSPGHKRNVLGDFKQVGCALKQCSSGCKYKTYWTCVYGTLMKK